MITFDVYLDGAKRRRLTKIEIINRGRVGRNGKYRYEVKACDIGYGREVDPDTYRSTFFNHNYKDDLFVLIKKAMSELLKSGIESRRRIPADAYKQVEGSRYVTPELVKEHHTPSEAERFFKFMMGQTSCVHGIYPEDYERWLSQGMNSEQQGDWD